MLHWLHSSLWHSPRCYSDRQSDEAGCYFEWNCRFFRVWIQNIWDNVTKIDHTKKKVKGKPWHQELKARYGVFVARGFFIKRQDVRSVGSSELLSFIVWRIKVMYVTQKMFKIFQKSCIKLQIFKGLRFDRHIWDNLTKSTKVWSFEIKTLRETLLAKITETRLSCKEVVFPQLFSQNKTFGPTEMKQ